MRRVQIVLGICLIATLYGCGRSNDPLENFKVVVKKVENGLPTALGSDKTIVKAPEYDVKKTDSIVSPYVGTIKVSYSYRTKTSLPPPKHEAVRLESITAQYAQQENKWVCKSMSSVLENWTWASSGLPVSMKEGQSSIGKSLYKLNEDGIAKNVSKNDPVAVLFSGAR